MRKSIKGLLSEKKQILGCFIQIPSPELVEMAAPYDYVILDYEHGHMTEGKLIEMIRAAESVNLAVMVRTPLLEAGSINKILDMGVSGLLISDVSTVQDAETIVSYSHYYPMGTRGACPFTRANSYGGGATPDEYYRKKNEEVFIGVTIENLEGVTNLEKIIQVEGVDCVGTGQYDLSVALGIPGDTRNPKVLEIAAKAEQLAGANNKLYTTMVMRPEETQAHDLDVCRLIMCGAPEMHLQNYLRETANQVRSILCEEE